MGKVRLRNSAASVPGLLCSLVPVGTSTPKGTPEEELGNQRTQTISKLPARDDPVSVSALEMTKSTT